MGSPVGAVTPPLPLLVANWQGIPSGHHKRRRPSPLSLPSAASLLLLHLILTAALELEKEGGAPTEIATALRMYDTLDQVHAPVRLPVTLYWQVSLDGDQD